MNRSIMGTDRSSFNGQVIANQLEHLFHLSSSLIPTVFEATQAFLYFFLCSYLLQRSSGTAGTVDGHAYAVDTPIQLNRVVLLLVSPEPRDLRFDWYLKQMYMVCPL